MGLRRDAPAAAAEQAGVFTKQQALDEGHLTAGALHGFPLPDPVEGHVVGPPGLRRAYRLRSHTERLDGLALTTLGGLVVTTAARSAVDCLNLLPVEDGLDHGRGCPPARC
jgi:hypothetical protein